MRTEISSSIILLVILPILFIACERSAPVPEKTLVKIYSDIVIMQDTSKLSQSDIKLSVLKKFNVNEKNYEETIKFYNRTPEKWQNFFDSVIVYIERKQPKSVKPDVKSSPVQSSIKDN